MSWKSSCKQQTSMLSEKRGQPGKGTYYGTSQVGDVLIQGLEWIMQGQELKRRSGRLMKVSGDGGRCHWGGT